MNSFYSYSKKKLGLLFVETVYMHTHDLKQMSSDVHFSNILTLTFVYITVIGTFICTMIL